MSYQFLPSAAIDVTAFAKNTTGQVVVGKNEAVDISNTYGVLKMLSITRMVTLLQEWF